MSASRQATGRSGETVAIFRSGRVGRPLYPYEQLTSADRWDPGIRRNAEAILAGQWCWKGRSGVSVAPPLDWDGLSGDDRSWGLALHSWEPLTALLATFDHTGDSACLGLALELAVDWLERFPRLDDASPFAWYDLAVGSRAYRLAYMLDLAARDAQHEDRLVSLLLAGLRRHAAALEDESRFARHSNHGLYQVMGQLAMARRFPDLPEAIAAGTLGRLRLDALLDSQFTREGVHREHSPHYHDLVLIPLRALLRAGLVRDPGLDALYERIEDALAWFVTPAGCYAMFGDTSRQAVTRSGSKPSACSPTLRFALGGGLGGEPPASRSRGFPESGYVVFRDRWPVGERDFADCSYLAQTAAFHSRVHKHADDLSFVWYDRGHDIFMDSGRFGYVGKEKLSPDLVAEGFWYSDPRRIYVESTHAHNTVEVDGRCTPRHGIQPYGSALAQYGERGEILFSESRVSHSRLSHTRVLLFLPREWLLVIDHLSDAGEERHNFAQRFHLAPELDLIQDRAGGSIATDLPAGDRLYALPLLPQAPLDPVRGAEEPRLLGWISSRDGVLEPRWAFGWEATDVPSHTFASLFCFAEQAPDVDMETNVVNADASMAELAWETGGERHHVGFERVFGRSFQIRHRRITVPQASSGR